MVLCYSIAHSADQILCCGPFTRYQILHCDPLTPIRAAGGIYDFRNFEQVKLIIALKVTQVFKTHLCITKHFLSINYNMYTIFDIR
jgi:hypothetical protein